MAASVPINWPVGHAPVSITFSVLTVLPALDCASPVHVQMVVSVFWVLIRSHAIV
jgi:hypothetical protein